MRQLDGGVAHGVWLFLAGLDACLLVYLVLSYRWFGHTIPAGSTPAAIIVYTIGYAIIALITAFEIGLVAVIGAGIARQFLPELLSSRALKLLAAIPLITLLLTLV